MLRATFLMAIGCLASLNAQAVPDERAVVRELSTRFEAARNRGDLAEARQYLADEATFFDVAGRDNRSLLYDLAVTARRRAASGRDRLEHVRVISRRVSVRGDVAIVTELLGATAAIPAAERITPRRRTIVWVKEVGGWKVSHLHTSRYSLWESAIQEFESADREMPPPPNGVVFVGSSSIVGWRTLADDFPQVTTTRRGFGGSDIIDSVAYAHRIITPYRPRRIALYAGDNDIARGKTPARVFEDYKLFVATIHTVLPEATIGFVAIKPSLARWKLWPQMKIANQQIQQHAAAHPRLDFLDIASPMLGDDGRPQAHLFVQDGLHLSPDGYALWTKVMTAWVNATP
ncbi:MAG: GDSL-type esterase/lipase family protein [Planctomycetota bacterium]|nr:GDSL-type esterase/lipase family protein [Planctomycetota bacterium]